MAQSGLAWLVCGDVSVPQPDVYVEQSIKRLNQVLYTFSTALGSASSK